LDLARAPRRTARKKGSGYENAHAPHALAPVPHENQRRLCNLQSIKGLKYHQVFLNFFRKGMQLVQTFYFIKALIDYMITKIMI
jgi:hypothetical protein